MPASIKSHWPALVPVAVALALGLSSLDFGLPFLFRPDEDVMVGRAVRMAAEGSLDPLFANYPPLVFYIFAIVEKAVGHLDGAVQSDPSGAYIAARAVSASAIAITVGLVFLAARHCYCLPAGILAGMAMAVAPLATRQAHFATTDAVQTALVAAALLTGLTATGRRSFVLAGALCGLAAAAKYTGGVAIVLVVVMAARRGSSGRAALLPILVAAAAGFWVPSLVILAHPGAYLQGLSFLGGNAYRRDFGLPIGWLYHPTVTLPYGFGFGAYAMSLVGAAYAARSRRPGDIGLLAYVLAYYLISGAGHENFYRYMLPLLPALAILAGGLLRAAPARLQLPAIAAALLLLAPGLYASIATDRLLGTTDTRVLAARWLDANAAPGSNLESPYYGGPFYDQGTIDRQLQNVPDPLAAGFLQGRYTDRYRINRQPAAYVIVASAPPIQWPPPAAAEAAAFRAAAATGPAVYDSIDSMYLPIWGFQNVQRPGPSLAIIRP